MEQPVDYTELEGETRLGTVITDNRLYDIEDQIKNLNRLGVNLLKNIDIDNDDQFIDLLHFINEHYISIPFNQNEWNRNTFTTMYMLLVVDMYHVILPNYIQDVRLKDFNSIDEFVQARYSDDRIVLLKDDLLDSIGRVITSVKRFKELVSQYAQTSTTLEDIDSILEKFAKYAEIIGANDDISLRKFLRNYIVPVLNRYYDDLIWRV